jgi:hypothetical protein
MAAMKGWDAWALREKNVGPLRRTQYVVSDATSAAIDKATAEYMKVLKTRFDDAVRAWTVSGKLDRVLVVAEDLYLLLIVSPFLENSTRSRLSNYGYEGGVGISEFCVLLKRVDEARAKYVSLLKDDGYTVFETSDRQNNDVVHWVVDVMDRPPPVE